MSPWWVPVVYGTTLLPFLFCLVRYWRASRGSDSPVRPAFLALYGAMVAVLGYATAATALDLPRPLRLVLMLALLGGVQVAGWLQYRAIARAQQRTPAGSPRRRRTDL